MKLQGFTFNLKHSIYQINFISYSFVRDFAQHKLLYEREKIQSSLFFHSRNVFYPMNLLCNFI
ncbi:hypothetical protein C9J47_21265 [Photobacterium indicum]|uniref:Uncharacterized protein n=1 Tax=Photobacterium indicum TaxID=81447 RepID=A0A2T3L4B2_9GAMM|nr:hypothetical protein C9J47_21265 [Photobacterium indicum]